MYLYILKEKKIMMKCTLPLQSTQERTNRESDRQTDRQMDIQTDRQMDRWTDRQRDKQRETDRNTEISRGTHIDKVTNKYLRGIAILNAAATISKNLNQNGGEEYLARKR